jgi:hypothetical protein
MSHADPGELVDYARQLLAGDAEHRVRAHLEGCVPCRRAFERLSLLVRVARGARAADEEAVRRVEAVVATSRPTPLVRARTIFDNLLQPLPAGVRGTVRDRHLLFEAGDWTVDVRLDQRPGRTSLTGQLAHSVSARPCSGVPVLARWEGQVVGRALTGSWGEFTLDCDERSPLTVELLVPATGIAIELPPREA